MPKKRISPARNLLRVVMMLIFGIIIGLFAWGSWQLHENEKLSQQYIVEGQPVVVKITAADRQNRTWYDWLGNPVYITFKYHNHSYTTRYQPDSGSVNEGDRLALLYHAQLDAFRQPGKRIHFTRQNDRSRLIQFSITNMWSDERKWFMLSLAFSTVFFFILLGILNSIIQAPLLQHLGRFIILGLVLCGTLYFTYNSWQYYNYYQKIKDNSSKLTTRVLSTDHHARSKRSNWWYRYDAQVQYGNEQKMIPIEKEDYNKLRPNDQLPVLYNRELNDMMPENYTPDHSNLLVVLFMWSLTIFFAWNNFFRRKR
jgi:uncharacterized protein YxeA